MKKLAISQIISLLLVTAIVIVFLGGCSKIDSEETIPNNSIRTENNTTGTGENTETLKKLDEKIKFASDYSEGLAFVCTNTNQQYFINKNGEIVIDIKGASTLANTKFINGFAVIDQKGSVCGKDGNITTPESVGAAYFYTDALAGGYIIAHCVEANYAGSNNKLGVLDLNFQWLIKPTEENFQLLADKNGNLPDMGTNAQNYFYKDYLYISGLQQFLFLKDFTLHTEWEYDSIPETWQCWNGNRGIKYTYISHNDAKDPVLELKEIPNLYGCSDFVGNNAVATFYNESANQSFFTLIDVNGNFMFEPVNAFDGAIGSYIAFDGNYIVVSGTNAYKSFDKSGNLIGEMKKHNVYSTPLLSDGILCIDTSYYNIDFRPLF